MSTGKVIQVIGPVVDVEFPPGQLPNIYNALKVTQEENKAAGKPAVRITLEVASHLGENRVRGIAMSTTDGLTRGMDVQDTGAPISVPVGRETLGRLINVLGEPVDEKGPIKAKKTYPIHRPAPRLEDQDTKTEVLETGIKVLDLLEPYSKGGKVGLFGGAGAGGGRQVHSLAKGAVAVAAAHGRGVGPAGLCDHKQRPDAARGLLWWRGT